MKKIVMTALVALTVGAAPQMAPAADAGAVLTGAAIGAATGAVVGQQSNRAGQGAFFGGVMGAMVGAIISEQRSQTVVVQPAPQPAPQVVRKDEHEHHERYVAARSYDEHQQRWQGEHNYRGERHWNRERPQQGDQVRTVYQRSYDRQYASNSEHDD